MKLHEYFVTNAGQAGWVQILTEYTLEVAFLCFLLMAVFCLASKDAVLPEHKVSATITALICLAAGVSYALIRTYYHAMLETLVATDDPAEQRRIIYQAYVNIGQYRYMDWTVTTPLLLVKNLMVLRVKPHQVPLALTALLTADVLMVLCGYIGEQQLGEDGAIQAAPHYLWGGISTLFYLVIPVMLYRVYRRFASHAEPEERTAYRWLAYATVTTWGVYPLGYMVPTLFPHANLNWLHIAFSVADVYNKVGLGVVAYLAAAKLLEKQVPANRIMPARSVG
ncbi:MAG: bacteriorhodopsin [Rhodospirillales bacterium]|nr:bacteriorhodopsin [Acetobacter sp.]